jgi:hypothetical protein
MLRSEAMGTSAELWGPRGDRSEALNGSLGARRLLPWIERNALPIAVASLYAVVVLLLIPAELVQDSWAALVAGRAVAHDGLPNREALTVMAHGVRWVDQQWLGQLTLYDLFRVGGLKLVMFTHATLIVSAFAMALAAARRRGASPLSVFIVAIPCGLVAPWGWQLRAQTFAVPLFVIVLWLLIRDSRSPSRRVFFVFPLLALWANLHGSVALGAAVAALYGATYLVSQCLAPARAKWWALRAAALMGLPAIAVLCSPYGLSLIGYYRRLLLNPALGQFVGEWSPSSPSARTAVFYALAFGATWSVAKWGRRLTAFELLVLIVTLAAAIDATRNIIWFGFAAMLIVPLTVDEAWRPSDGIHRPVRIAVAITSLVGVAAAAIVALGQPTATTTFWPDKAAAAVAAATRDPSTRVFASDRYADWLLWRDPELSGRVAFDIRFELLTREQLRQVYRYFNLISPAWPALGRDYQVFVIDRVRHGPVYRALLRSPDMHLVYRDAKVAVVTRRHGR